MPSSSLGTRHALRHAEKPIAELPGEEMSFQARGSLAVHTESLQGIWACTWNGDSAREGSWLKKLPWSIYDQLGLE
jgi:hypothetical protein